MELKQHIIARAWSSNNANGILLINSNTVKMETIMSGNPLGTEQQKQHSSNKNHTKKAKERNPAEKLHYLCIHIIVYQVFILEFPCHNELNHYKGIKKISLSLLWMEKRMGFPWVGGLLVGVSVFPLCFLFFCFFLVFFLALLVLVSSFSLINKSLAD
jgi:hypothetical protein